MPCCKKPAKNQVQKVVIPKGMINPGETTIIEIPSNLQRQPIVVAKRKSQNEMDDQRYASAIPGGRIAPQNIGGGMGSRDVRSSQYSQRSDKSCARTMAPDEKDKKKKNKNSSGGYECGSGVNYGKHQQSAANLDKTEQCEREQFLQDLEEFQKARRKLLANASFMANKDFK